MLLYLEALLEIWVNYFTRRGLSVVGGGRISRRTVGSTRQCQNPTPEFADLEATVTGADQLLRFAMLSVDVRFVLKGAHG